MNLNAFSSFSSPDVYCNTIAVLAPAAPYSITYGIRTVSCLAPALHNNDVSAVSPATNAGGWIGHIKSKGIYVAQSLRSSICSNHIQNFERDLECEGFMNPSYIISNQFQQGKYGFVLRGTQANVGYQTLPPYGHPGCTVSKGLENFNNWLDFKGTSVTGNYHTLNDGAANAGVNNSIFFTRYSPHLFCPWANNPNFAQPHILIAQKSVQFRTYVQGALCLNVQGCNAPNRCNVLISTSGHREEYYEEVPEPLDSTDIESEEYEQYVAGIDTDWVHYIITDTLLYNLDTLETVSEAEVEYSALRHFFSRQQLYMAVMSDSNFVYLDSALLAGFMDTMQYNDIGKIYAAETLLHHFMTDSTVNDTIWQIAQSIYDSTAIGHTVGSILLDNVSSTLNSISGNIQPSLNSKTVLGVYKELLADDSAVLDSAMSAMLFEVAIQCPWIGGKAVYHARNILEQFDTTYIDYADWCENNDSLELRFEERNISTKKKPTDEEIVIYPNPTDGIINIKYAGISGDSWFVIYDIVGKEIERIWLNGERGLKQYQTSKLSNGLYLYKVKSITGKNNLGGKLTIAK